MIKKISILTSLTISLTSFCWYGFLPDNMKLSDAICIEAHHAEALDTRGWNIPVQYGTFYDLMAKHGARYLDVRLHLGTDEELVFESTGKDIKNVFDRLFAGEDVTKPRQKPIAFIGCHEHDKYEANCWFTRFIEKRGKPDIFQFFVREIKKFLDNNPKESIFVDVGGFIQQFFTSDINGWKGRTNQYIAECFDNIIKDEGLLPRTFTQKITENTTVGDIRGKVAFFTDAGGVLAHSSVLKNYPPTTWNSWNLTKKECVLKDDTPDTLGDIFTATVLQPTNPFDSSLDQGLIKKIIDTVPDFLAGGSKEKLIWNYATEVNTVENIFNSIKCCRPDKKVNIISFNFLSKYGSRMPLDIIYETNTRRMQSVNDILQKTEGMKALNKMLYDPLGGLRNYLEKIK